MSDRYKPLSPVPGSKALAFLAGMSQLDTDVCYPTCIFQRSTLISNTVLSDSQDRKVLGDWEFWCDGILARIESVVTDVRPASQFLWINVKESGSGKQMFPDDMPVSLLSGASGAAVGGATFPTENYNGFTSRTFEIPFIFRAGATITFQFRSDGTLPAGARVSEIMLTGYMVRKGAVVLDAAPQR